MARRPETAVVTAQKTRGQRVRRHAASLAWLALTLVAGAGTTAACSGPKYPLCDNDEECNVEGHKGVCVDRKCVECRDDTACGAGRQCQAGACAPIPGFCDEAHPCLGGSTCGKDSRCHDEPKVAEA